MTRIVLLVLVFGVAQAADEIALPSLSLALDGTTVELAAVPEPNLDRVEPSIVAGLAHERATVARLMQQATPDRQSLTRAYGRLGQSYQANSIYAPAEPAYRNAIALQADEPRWWYYLGYLYQQSARADHALPPYNETLRLQPDYAPARLRLGLALIELGRSAEAIAELKKIQELPGVRAEALGAIGRAELAQGNHRAAADALQTALAENPAASELHYPLAMALRGLGDVAGAREHLAARGEGQLPLDDPWIAAMTQRMTGARTHYFRALQYVNEEDFQKAAEGFQLGLLSDPNNRRARTSLARTLFLAGDRQAAHNQLLEVVRRWPEHPLAWFLLGLLADGDGDEQQALTYYKRSLEDEPDHAGANFFLAYQEMTADNCQMAAERFARVVRQTPENIVAVRSEILCRWQSGSSEAALLASIDHALIRHRDDPELSAWRIRLLATATDPRVRDPHTALKAGEKLYESTARPDVLEALAMAQAANGYYEKAAASQDVVVGQMMMFGAFDILPPAEARLERYRQGLPAESAWLPDDPVFRAPPVDVDGAFRHYPMDMAY
ncbi:MAG: tetratricopeptide repeat protein [Chromatiales bacterium]|nr:tetratricopeptide repeat protein [Chromatiales bacterium]